MAYRITGIDPAPFRPLFGLDEAALAEHRAQRFTAGPDSAFPDRVELRDLRPGETALLVNYEHQPADTPYRSRHAIFVLEGAGDPVSTVDALPPALASRMLSLRAFDCEHMIVDAVLVHGGEADPAIHALLADPAVDYVHAHYATRGCFAASITRE